MSPSFAVRKRLTSKGAPRWQVMWRAGGRDSTWKGLGTFATERDARARLRWAQGELAAGRRPDPRRILEAPKTLLELFDEYGATHRGASAKKRHRQARARLGDLGTMAVDTVTGRDVQAWVMAQADLGPDSIRQYLGEIRRTFAWGEVYPNPAEWSHLRIPRPDEEEIEDPPSLAEFEATRAAIAPKHRAALVVLEGTGMRVSELVGLRWGDVDLAGSRIRVAARGGRKTRAALRFVPLVEWVREAIEAQAPLEDRASDRAVFPHVTDHSMRGALRQAAKWSGGREFSPHDFRHRFTTLAQLAGIPAVNVREIVGHTKLSTTHDVYTWSILDEPEERLAELRRAWARMVGVDPRGAKVAPPTHEPDPNPAMSRAEAGDGGYRARITPGVGTPPSPSGSARMGGETDGGD